MTGELHAMLRLGKRIEDAGEAQVYERLSSSYTHIFKFEDGTELELNTATRHYLKISEEWQLAKWLREAWQKVHPPGIPLAEIDEQRRRVSSRDDKWRRDIEDMAADW
jgi:hypothetical protein